MDSDYDSPIGTIDHNLRKTISLKGSVLDDVEPGKDIFIGFSPERENQPPELETFITV